MLFSVLLRYLLAPLPCILLVLFFLYEMDMALRAPVCASSGELGSWCLPLGWEGPFADFWANRSRGNAIANASLNLGLSLTTLAACMALLFRHEAKHLRWSSIALLQMGLIVVLVFKGQLLSDPS